jgi:hypothetical protein
LQYKREVAYLGKGKTADYKTITVIYTGSVKPAAGRVMTGIFGSRRHEAKNFALTQA